MEYVEGQGIMLKEVDAGTIWNGRPAMKIIKQFLEDIKGRGVNVKVVVLISSRARGDWKPWSDIDLLVVIDRDENRRKIPVGLIDVKPYTVKELLEGIRKCEVEVIEAFEYGKVILDDGTWAYMRSEYEKVKRKYGIERYRGGWRVRRK